MKSEERGEGAQRELIEQKTGAIETLHPTRLAVSICGGLFGFAAGQLIRNHQQDKQTDPGLVGQKMMMMGCWPCEQGITVALSL